MRVGLNTGEREHTECHRLTQRHPGARASLWVQNRRSPFAVSMRVFAYDAPRCRW